MPTSPEPHSTVTTRGGPVAGRTLDDVPLSRFHLRITAMTFGANFSDGYHLGTIGIALTAISPQMHLSSVWQGWLGSSALIGVFFGSLLTGWIGDKVGRKQVYIYDFLLVAIASAAQFFVNGPTELLVIRLVIGIGVGADYAIGPSLVAEFVPRRYRGGLLASLTVLWTVGYVAAYFCGNYLVNLAPDGWRWLLATGAVPALAVLLLRLGTPESPRWLIARGRHDEARSIITHYFGAHVHVPHAAQHSDPSRQQYRNLFKGRYLKRTIFGLLFFNCQVIPYFAIYTFLPIILVKLGWDDRGFLGGGMLNLALLLGGAIGLWFVVKVSRRRLLVYTFLVMAASLGTVSIGTNGPTWLILLAFIVFTLVMSGVSNIEQVYPPELYPTELRGSGVGMLNAGSRVGSAAGTFILPIALAGFGFTTAMLGMVGLLVIGAIGSARMAPETAHLSLDEAAHV